MHPFLKTVSNAAKSTSLTRQSLFSSEKILTCNRTQSELRGFVFQWPIKISQARFSGISIRVVKRHTGGRIHTSRWMALQRREWNQLPPDTVNASSWETKVTYSHTLPWLRNNTRYCLWRMHHGKQMGGRRASPQGRAEGNKLLVLHVIYMSNMLSSTMRLLGRLRCYFAFNISFKKKTKKNANP